ncbi:S-adenosyl-L-methionine-dependent methyltransferase superfamily protein [Forsythia ovata]|uniref:S-adenosyl-L-methionine-dependent methyltransferase superfamily protein n=1 Tax=Forsythia ovata TaxID=205694 RepID=A0ABD1UZP1_9LAMI
MIAEYCQSQLGPPPSPSKFSPATSKSEETSTAGGCFADPFQATSKSEETVGGSVSQPGAQPGAAFDWVVELDPVVLDVARDYFSFGEDKHLKVHITDGIKFVREIANFEAADTSTTDCGNENDTSNGNVSNGSSIEVHADGRSSNKIDILIIDVDSSDLSSGLTCPASEFVEESFLLTVKYSLSEQGLFVINLVSRSSAVKDKVFSRLQTVFSNIFSLQLEEDLNEVIFALNDSPIEENQFSEACDALARLLELEKPEWSQSIIDGTKLIKRLR